MSKSGVRGGPAKKSPARFKKVNPGFLQAAKSTREPISESLLRQARRSGQLNLSTRELTEVPANVWRINEPPKDAGAEGFESQGDERWWDQVALTRLNLSSNELTCLSEEIELLPELQALDVQYNKLSDLPHAVGLLSKLTRLLLSHNELTELPQDVCLLSSLQVLWLDNNKLTTLPQDITKLGQLEELRVSNNKLSSLPEALDSLSHLSLLQASNNKLTGVPPSLGYMRGLRELSLAVNKITDLPPFTDLKNLRELDLRQNQLTSFPKFNDGGQLKSLLLGSNRISSLDEECISTLSELTILELRENKIAKLPEYIVKLTSLQRLDLTNNDLSGLPPVLGTMDSLQSVLLEGNSLRTLRREIVAKGTSELLKYLRSRMETLEVTSSTPTRSPAPSKYSPFRPTVQHDASGDTSVLEETPSVTKEMDLTKNNLTTIPSDVFLSVHITTLNVGFNKLVSVPADIGLLTSLSVLDLRNNRLSDLPAQLKTCVQLKDIVLSYNHLSVLPTVLYDLPSLENIIANDNQIELLDVQGLQRLPVLGCLDVHNNSISSIPPQLGNIASLRHLDLSGNVFRTPRAAILAKGTPALLEYLRDRIPT